MIRRCMWTVYETSGAIRSDKSLLVAGDESVLSKLPSGQWIGGTIPYFMGDEGGRMDRERLHVTLVPDYVQNADLKTYDENT